MHQRKIGILIAHWNLHSSVCYMAECLAREGYSVDIFLFATKEGFSAGLLESSPAIAIHRLDPPQSSAPSPKQPSIARKLYDALPQIVKRFYRASSQRFFLVVNPGFKLIPNRIVDAVVKRAQSAPYAALIGVEKGGLAWAGAVTERCNSALIYYSLELFTSDHPNLQELPDMRRLKRLEEKHHARCAFTIIQDEHRAKVLMADNKLQSKMPVAYLPISLMGPAEDLSSHFLQDRLGLNGNTVLILSYGLIAKRRLNPELASVAQTFPEDWVLVFHGYGDEDAIAEIRSVDRRNKVRFSLSLVPARDRAALISSAKIGLAIYRPKPINDRLTGFSSEKIALYLQSGIPVVALRYETYEHIEQEEAGILVSRLEEIPDAISRILRAYESYRKGAFACYERHYRFETNFRTVTARLADVLPSLRG